MLIRCNRERRRCELEKLFFLAKATTIFDNFHSGNIWFVFFQETLVKGGESRCVLLYGFFEGKRTYSVIKRGDNYQQLNSGTAYCDMHAHARFQNIEHTDTAYTHVHHIHTNPHNAYTHTHVLGDQTW